MNDRGSQPDHRWLPPPSEGGLLRKHVQLEPIALAAPSRPSLGSHASPWRWPLLLILVCSGMLVGLGIAMLAPGRQRTIIPARASSATDVAASLPVVAVKIDVEEYAVEATETPSAEATSPAAVVAVPKVAAISPAPALVVAPPEEAVVPAETAPVKEAVVPQAAVAATASPAPVVELNPAPVPAGPEIAKFPLTSEDAKRIQLAWAKYLKQPAVANNQLDMKLVLLPPGEMFMGSSRDEIGREDQEGPQRKVRLTTPCYIGAHEVTVGQFARFATATRYVAEPLQDRDDDDDDDDDDDRGRGFGRGRGRGARSPRPAAVPDHAWYHTKYAPSATFPVVQLTWADAVAFCDWLSELEGRRYRLPTEAEWEFACRAGSQASTSWGEAPREHAKHAWFRENSGGRTRAVGELRSNAWGMYDMHGNVAEWCHDWMAAYGSADEVDPRGPADGGERVLRGGAWDASRLGQRSAWRGSARPSEHSERVGFRVVCEFDPARLAEVLR